MNKEQTTNNALPETKPVLSATFSHRQLCKIAANVLKNKGIKPFHRCQYVVCELERHGECPDAFGFSSASTQLIEAKVSRSDFLSDKKKLWRKFPENGLGNFRSYLCPNGLINIEDLPEKWGLLWVDEYEQVKEIKAPQFQQSSHVSELNLAMSIMRREGISSRIFSYKNYKK